MSKLPAWASRASSGQQPLLLGAVQVVHSGTSRRDPPAGSSMITIASFSKPEEAHMLRLRLGAGGVRAFIQDENLVQIDWLYSNAIGGVRVQILEQDIERAREILAEPPLTADPASTPPCPKCGSGNTRPEERPRRLAFLGILLVGFPYAFSTTRWTCPGCRRSWNEKNRPSP